MKFIGDLERGSEEGGRNRERKGSEKGREKRERRKEAGWERVGREMMEGEGEREEKEDGGSFMCEPGSYLAVAK